MSVRSGSITTYMIERLRKLDLTFNWLSLSTFGYSGFDTISDRRVGEPLSRWRLGGPEGGGSAVRLIAAMMSAAWLPTFIHLNRNPRF
jgi:hypothetical protein